MLGGLKWRCKAFGNCVGPEWTSCNGVAQGDSASILVLLAMMAIKARRDVKVSLGVQPGTYIDDNSALALGDAAVATVSACDVVLQEHGLTKADVMKLVGAPISTKRLASFVLPNAAMDMFDARVAKIARLPNDAQENSLSQCCASACAAQSSAAETVQVQD
eukprot:2170144-Amphidinium_carterae.1